MYVDECTCVSNGYLRVIMAYKARQENNMCERRHTGDTFARAGTTIAGRCVCVCVGVSES